MKIEKQVSELSFCLPLLLLLPELKEKATNNTIKMNLLLQLPSIVQSIFTESDVRMPDIIQ